MSLKDRPPNFQYKSQDPEPWLFSFGGPGKNGKAIDYCYLPLKCRDLKSYDMQSKYATMWANFWGM